MVQQNLRDLFQHNISIETWQQVLQHWFPKATFRAEAEKIDSENPNEQAYYLGSYKDSHNTLIGLFYFDILQGSVDKRRVGLRRLVKQFINPRWGSFDAALVVFRDNQHWRLSLICDDKGKDFTTPRRYTYVFGDKNHQYKTPIERLGSLKENPDYEQLKEAFSVEALTEEFYKELFNWYQWAIDEKTGVTFPNLTDSEEDNRDNIETHIIRLITRLMFVWFIKQKDLVPNKLFDEQALSDILKDFQPQSQDNGNYYHAILQNLFFATLNRAIIDENGSRRQFAKIQNKRDIRTLYRYEEMFAIDQQQVINDLFGTIPFLNGGLFECLDKTKNFHGEERFLDGFSRNQIKHKNGNFKYCAFVPNNLFFAPEDAEHEGLISLLSRYNFTVEENSFDDMQVALDPELLGKVFENLLGTYNPETKETARNASGSFYTPREVVQYMVDESLIAYLSGKNLGDETTIRELFNSEFQYCQDKKDWYATILSELKKIKILDPACGSGAFPMGLLNRIVEIMLKITPTQQHDIYNLKLHLIQHCIYGSDIQPIAAQITKLRFFISLICDIEKHGDENNNFGIPTLPNLETHFVVADSLLSIDIPESQPQQGQFDFADDEIEKLQDELTKVREQHFSAKNAYQKTNLREEDEKLRQKLGELLADTINADWTDNRIKKLVEWNPYDQMTQAQFFDPEWMFGIDSGFDIIIGNPPYIQLQNDGGKLGRMYQPFGYKTFASTGDIYCLFYERGYQLLKQGGHLCFITSNKWMRAGYGEKTREFFAQNTNPLLLIDFAGVQVFKSATVDTNILLFAKQANAHQTRCAVANKQNKDSIKNMSDFVRQQAVQCAFSGSDSWVVLSEIEQSIKRKIEAVGTPLKDWDISINYGIKTGCNEAFIIDTAKRDEILANCQSDEERIKTAELIRPILRGRDIQRYGYQWADLWLIYVPWHFPYQFDNSIQGASGKAEKAFQQQYPAVFNHLLKYKEPLSNRNKAETGIRYEWYALQRWGAKYWEDFFKPKIIYPNMTKYMPFVFDNQFYLTNQKCFIITGKYVAFLTAFFNSSLFKYCFRDSFPELQGGTRELSKIFFDKIPIIKVDEKTDLCFKKAIIDIQQDYTKQKAIAIDSMIFDLYKLSDEERQVIGFVEIQ